MSKTHHKNPTGFTIIEVTLVLALTGVLLIGIISTTFSSIASQRYNDSVRSFAEYLRATYSEVISPESLGKGNSNKYSVLGKVMVFGYNYGAGSIDSDTGIANRSVISASLIGNAKIPISVDGGFVNELAAVDAQLYCGQNISGYPGQTTVKQYELLWEAELMEINDSAHIPPLSSDNRFTGTIIIARSPTSGTVHTIYTSKTYDLLNGCASSTATSASYSLQNDIQNYSTSPSTASVKFSSEELGFCIKSGNSPLLREVRLAADGRNTSAVSIIDADSGDNRCQ